MSKLPYEEFYDEEMNTEIHIDGDGVSSDRHDPILKMRDYLDSKPGYAVLTSIFFLTAGWVILVTWSQNKENHWQAEKISGITSFFLFATITPWAMMLFLMTLMALRRKKKINVWFCIIGYFSVFWSIIVICASSVLYHNATLVLCQRYRCNVLKYVAASLGIIGGLSLAVQAYLHLRVLKKNRCCKESAPYSKMTKGRGI
eukprot:TCONS_00009409-protein